MATKRTLSFGVPSINKPTPLPVKWVNRVITGLIGLYGAIILQSGTSIIPEHIQGIINPYIITIPSVTLYLSKMFGWNFTDENSNTLNNTTMIVFYPCTQTESPTALANKATEIGGYVSPETADHYATIVKEDATTEGSITMPNSGVINGQEYVGGQPIIIVHVPK